MFELTICVAHPWQDVGYAITYMLKDFLYEHNTNKSISQPQTSLLKLPVRVIAPGPSFSESTSIRIFHVLRRGSFDVYLYVFLNQCWLEWPGLIISEWELN